MLKIWKIGCISICLFFVFSQNKTVSAEQCPTPPFMQNTVFTTIINEAEEGGSCCTFFQYNFNTNTCVKEVCKNGLTCNQEEADFNSSERGCSKPGTCINPQNNNGENNGNGNNNNNTGNGSGSGISGGLKDCCVLRNDITIGNDKCLKGDYVPKTVEGKCPGNACAASNENNWGMFCVLNTVYSVTSWLFLILMSAVILMIIYGGFLYIVSQGLPERTKKAKQILTFAIIGLIVALLAKIIPSLVKFVMGVSS